MAASSSSSPSSSPQETENKPPQFPNSPKTTTQSLSLLIKKTQPLPWTHQETINLIQSYQDKWYSLNKGQLKSFQWEEVSVTVAARCGYDQPSKSATQCRHKIEKLRKRYRAEKLKPFSHSWPYFDLMDSMESGPLPITMARPIYNDDSDDDDDDDDDVDYNLNKSRSINHIVKGGKGNTSSVDNVVEMKGDFRAFGVSRKPIVGKRKEIFEIDDDDDDDEEKGGADIVTELAVQIRTFAQNFVKVEQKKIQMMKDTAKYHMEMENKRMNMIIQSQQKLVDTIRQAFATSHKKMKMPP